MKFSKRIFNLKSMIQLKSFFLQLMVLFFRLNGLLPSTVDASTGRQIIPSKNWIFYHIFLIITILYSNFCVGIPKLIREANAERSKLAEMLEIIAIGVASGIAIIIWTLFPMNRRRGRIYVKKMTMADVHAKKFREKYMFESVDGISILSASAYILLWIPLIWTEWMTYGEPINWILWFSLYCGPSFVLTMFTIQFALTVKIMRRRFRSLNDTLCRHLEGTKKVDCFTRLYTDEPVMHDFETWKAAHHELYDATVIISDFYSLPILLVFGYTHYGILFNCFYVLKSSELSDLWGAEWTIANGILWSVILIIPTIILTVQIDKFNTEAKRKVEVCSKLIWRFNDNRRLRSQIKLYYQELLHEEFNFTAYGFFPLNGTLLRSVCATTVTYLVILYQLRGIEEPQNSE